MSAALIVKISKEQSELNSYSVIVLSDFALTGVPAVKILEEIS